MKLEYLLIFGFLTITASYLFFNTVTIEAGSLLTGLEDLVSSFIDFILELLGRLF